MAPLEPTFTHADGVTRIRVANFNVSFTRPDEFPLASTEIVSLLREKEEQFGRDWVAKNMRAFGI